MFMYKYCSASAVDTYGTQLCSTGDVIIHKGAVSSSQTTMSSSVRDPNLTVFTFNIHVPITQGHTV